MQLVLTEDQELLAKTASDFAAEHCAVARVRALRDSADELGYSPKLWKEMAELGWVGIPFSEAVGGADMGLAELSVVLEAMGRGLAPEPFLSAVLLGGQALHLGGSAAQQEAWLPGLVEGEIIVALAYQEAQSRYEVHRTATTATRSGGGFTLSGEKIQVLDGSAAHAYVVSARTSGAERDRDGVTLFLVKRAAPGVAVDRQSRLDSRGAALVTLDGVGVDASDVVGAEGQGADLLERVVDRATVGLCAEMLGSMSEAFERTLEYLKVRKQFGVPIGSFQALKHRAAEIFVAIELARSATMAASRAVDADDDESKLLVSLAKARCSDTGIHTANEAVQMHGGIGMTDEHEIGFFLKRARVAELTFGDSAWHRDRWARLRGY